VDAEEIVVGSATGLENVIGGRDFLAEEEFVEEAEFLRWENVGAEIEIVAGVVDKLEGEHGLDRENNFTEAISGYASGLGASLRVI